MSLMFYYKQKYISELIKHFLIDCPSTALQYPIFKPNRINFYNIALVVPEIYGAIRGYEAWSEENSNVNILLLEFA